MTGRALRAALFAALVLAPAALAGEPADDPVFAPGFPSGFALPAERRDPKVPAPEAVVGHRVGARYTTPEEIAAYVHALAAASPRLLVERYGTTPEGRELLTATVSTPANLARLGALREELAKAGDDESVRKRLLESAPATVWISCSIHGGEAAGGEAALALLYRLAASREPEVEELLSKLVVIVDPAANPDGRARHVAFSRGATEDEPDTWPDALEHDPPWPSGRFNHFGFDLNRDWAWATQPETRARIPAILRARPQVFVDVHEMGSENTYFFPPDAEPVHPHVPERTRKSLEAFGRALARAFDARGWSYFVRETYDLFYPAYGDSWPSLHGVAGMTFEMAGGGGGLARKRKDGTVLTLTERAVKHFTALTATLRDAAARRRDLLEDALAAAAPRKDAPVFAIPAGQDPGRVRRLARLLEFQGLRVEKTTAALEGKGERVPADSLVVDAAQPSGRFAQVLLERGAALPEPFLKEQRGRFLLDEPDGFYDVTAWSLPLAFGLHAITLSDRRRLEGKRAPWHDGPAAAPAAEARYGWLFPGEDFESRGAAGRLLAAGANVEVVTKRARSGDLAVAPGSFLVRRENNAEDIAAKVSEAARASGARALPLAGAWTDEGPSFGSSSVAWLKRPRVAVVAGEGVDATSAGSLVLALERDLGVAPHRVRASALADADLSDVDVLVLPHGGGALKRELEREETAAALKRWVESGGVLVAVRGGAAALRTKGVHLSEAKTWEPPEEKKEGDEKHAEKEERKPEEAPSAAAAKKPEPAAPDEDPDLVRDLDRRPLALPGAALKARGVAGDPLLFGLPAEPVVLVLDDRPPKRLPRARDNVLSVVSSEPLAAGFGWREALARWAGAPVLQSESVGRGKVITFALEPAFRGVWLSTEVLFLNAVLFGPSL